MEKQKYQKPEVKDLGSIQDLTLGNVGGGSQDKTKITIPGVGNVFGTLSGNPLRPA